MPPIARPVIPVKKIAKRTIFMVSFPPNSTLTQRTNMATHPPKVLIIGTGIAGLTAAIHFSEFSDVILLAKTQLDEGNTRYAQGGIAAVWSETDSLAEHKQDTLIAGAGLCRESTVDICVSE